MDRTDPLSVKALYDEAFTSVNPSNVFVGYGNRFPQVFPTPWRSKVINMVPVHYPNCESIAGLPGGVYPITVAPDSRDSLITKAMEDAPMPQVMDPMTVRYQDMPTNPNGITIIKGPILSDDTR
jgi:hypothetical protein